MNLASQPLWSEGEIQVLHDFAPSYEEIMKRLSNRSLEAARHKRSRLGLTRNIHLWTGIEIAKLRRVYPGGFERHDCRRIPAINLGVDQVHGLAIWI
ncbi:MAG: hypothetical protein DI589_13765 [Shinella sp.]|nr:MAG: hypothetical protein DI589_13765 [Shinella sp.]